MQECIECYSEDNRVTPLLNPEECLENHTQYICGTCGRCICIDLDAKRSVQRWNFPFKSLDIARLYLRTADASKKACCGIYEIISSSGRKSFKIFACPEDLKDYLVKNRDKACTGGAPVYQRKQYMEFPGTQIRKLHYEEVKKYLSEMAK
jgi:hypothetical protein